MRGLSALKNIGYMTIAQIFVMLLSIIMSVFVPKFVGVTEFSYWQLFVFYASYTGCLHLGLNDGLYLKYGGIKLQQSECNSISNQLWFSIFVQIFILLLLYAILYQLTDSPERKIIYLYICVYAIINNIFNFCGSILQSINQIKSYSRALLLDKIFVMSYVFLILFLKKDTYDYLIWGYILGRSLALMILLYQYKCIFFAELNFSKCLIKEIALNIKSGYNLMIANIASSFILGVGRFVIDMHYSIEIFGKVSFALTLTGFVLALISQVGNSVFPILATKRIDFHRIMFPQIESVLQILLPICYLAYPIIYCLIYYYLPDYKESLLFFILIFPLCVFEAKISMLYNTYMKVLRLEHKLLVVNLISVIISTILVLLSYYIFKSINMILLSLVIAVVLKAFYLRRIISMRLCIPMSKPMRDLIISIMCIVPLLTNSVVLYKQILLLFVLILFYELFSFKDLKSSINNIFVK